MGQQHEADARLAAIQSALLAGRIDEAARRLEAAIHAGEIAEQAEWWHVRAVVAYHRNQLEDAIACWRQANQHEPLPHYRHNLATALCDLATATVERGELASAFTALCEAIEADPALFAAQAALGIVATELGQWPVAHRALMAAVRLDGSSARAHDALGILAGRQHRWTEAIRHHAEAVQCDARSAEACNNLGHALLQVGRPHEAIKVLEQALAIDRKFAEVHNNLGNAYRDCGRFVDAQQCFRQALQLKANLTEAQYNLADLHRYQADDAELKRLLQTPVPADASHAALLLFAKGKAFDDLGLADEAFANWREGNRLLRANNDYDEARTLGRLERLRGCFDDHRRPLPNPAPPPPPPNYAFIVGAPRCGSTLIEQILASHPAVHCLGEHNFFEQSVIAASPQIVDEPTAWQTWDHEQIDSIAKGYVAIAQAHAAASRGALFVDKFLANTLYLGGIYRALPTAKVIALFRDRRDLGLSCYSKRFTTGHSYAYDLGELGRYLTAHDRLLEAACRYFPQTNLIRIQYEELVEQPEPIIRRLLHFLDLPWHPACLESHLTSRVVTTASARQVREPINRHGVDRWRRYERHLAPLLETV